MIVSIGLPSPRQLQALSSDTYGFQKPLTSTSNQVEYVIISWIHGVSSNSNATSVAITKVPMTQFPAHFLTFDRPDTRLSRTCDPTSLCARQCFLVCFCVARASVAVGVHASHNSKMTTWEVGSC
eukprot:594240-Amphidinium_carterae.1